MKLVNRENAEHYKWKKICDGWHFIKTDELSVIAEKMPPNTSEDMHFHHKSKQFFYILSGEAEMKLKDTTILLKEGMGIEIEPMEVHQMSNISNEQTEFLVISTPKSHGDKEIVRTDNAPNSIL
jgi:mannose-6-phosphate isomerase-like protein (cupin superfamily)